MTIFYENRLALDLRLLEYHRSEMEGSPDQVAVFCNDIAKVWDQRIHDYTHSSLRQFKTGVTTVIVVGRFCPIMIVSPPFQFTILETKGPAGQSAFVTTKRSMLRS